MAAGAASEVVAETTKRRVILLEDNGLGLNFANLLSDDSGVLLAFLIQWEKCVDTFLQVPEV